MLRYPHARWAPLGPQTQPLMTAHDVLCYHTMVGYLTSTDGYFRSSNGAGYDGTESHYGVGGKWGPDFGDSLDGVTWTWQDRARTADANLDGNGYVISIETADNAPRYPGDIEAWTPKQVAELIRLGTWECSVAAHAECPPSWRCYREGIPAVLIPDTRREHRGIGYHKQGCPPNVVPGGVAWSRAMGKECPTARRITQLKTEIIPAIAANLRGGASPKPTIRRSPEMFLYAKRGSDGKAAGGIRLFTAAAQPVTTDLTDQNAAQIGKALSDPTHIALLGPDQYVLLAKAMGVQL